ncbi:AAA family ATPase [Chondromyces crocatus]|uniref:ATP-binding protein n=1 Tax=Chondromyces crocatus TaxID=52 RepID=A0A0K1ECY3_CHOCO|nr:AAA family ATPase [Chondromyces crocatus]AKT38730.1 ATP-binding protein [Chondromyces crocatus]
MTVTRLELLEFSAFQRAEIDCSPGINVIIGTNATGKSHAMKALYATLKVFETKEENLSIASRLAAKLANVFMPEDRAAGRIVRRKSGQRQANVRIEGSAGRIAFSLDSEPTEQPVKVEENTWKGESAAIYLPTREVLAMYEGFIAAYQDRELSFDETYFDACMALNRSALRGPRSEEAQRLTEPLERALGGKVKLQGNRFYVVDQDGEMEAHLVAEGLRKIASLAHLVNNGSLTKDGLLFWDEPEANLNPKLVKLVVELLIELGKHGVQIFLTTHDYLLSHQLSLLAEYTQHPDVPIKFFSFHREDGHGPVSVSSGATLAELRENPILEEFNRHYDFERKLFDESTESSS